MSENSNEQIDAVEDIEPDDAEVEAVKGGRSGIVVED